MKKYLILIILLLSFRGFSQEESFSSKIILFDYSYQTPITNMAIDFGHNSSIGLSYLQNKNDFLLGIDANFMFGNNVKNDSMLQLISTENGFLINSSGELDEVLLYERGLNTHILFGKSFRFEENYLTGIYIYGGIGYLQHKIRLESDRTFLPQIDDDYIKGYDKLTSGISTKICIDYMYFDKKNSVKYHIGVEFLNAFTTNKRPYHFSEMQETESGIMLDQLFSVKLGIVIPINRNNEEKFHYY